MPACALRETFASNCSPLPLSRPRLRRSARASFQPRTHYRFLGAYAPPPPAPEASAQDAKPADPPKYDDAYAPEPPKGPRVG